MMTLATATLAWFMTQGCVGTDSPVPTKGEAVAYAAPATCHDKWNRPSVGVPSKLLRGQGISTMDAVTTATGVEVLNYAACVPPKDDGQAFFLLLPDGQPAIAATQDQMSAHRTSCEGEPVSDYASFRIAVPHGAGAGERAFLLYGRPDRIRTFRLTSTAFSEGRPATTCLREGYNTVGYRAGDVEYFVQSQEDYGGSCLREVAFVTIGEQCQATGRFLGDCPEGGPGGTGLFGKPAALPGSHLDNTPRRSS